ncbi:hypothetical protein FI667_g8306, partial [Globisporangium splendens]
MLAPMQLNDYLRVFGGSFFFALATLLPFLNPPAIAPIFLSLTEGASSATRVVLAKRVATNVCLMLIVAMVAGNVLLSFFGISLSIVRVGGGMLVIAQRLAAGELARCRHRTRRPHGRIVHARNGQGPRVLSANLSHQLRSRLHRGRHHGGGLATRPESRIEPGTPGRLHSWHHRRFAHAVCLPALCGPDAAPPGRQWHRCLHAVVGLHHAVPGGADLLGGRPGTPFGRADPGDATNSRPEGLSMAGRHAGLV